VRRCVLALAPGGMLLIRELDPSGRQKRLAEILERMAVLVGWNLGARVHPWPADLLKSYLEGLGMRVRACSAGRGPFSGNAFLAARKPRGAGRGLPTESPAALPCAGR